MLRRKWWILLAAVFLTGVLAAQNVQQADAQLSSQFSGTFQQFQNGYMMWESDTGRITVLPFNAPAMIFPTNSYGYLRDNPVTEPAPAGFYKPLMGFGKVWGNFPQVRAQLGWAHSGEQGHNFSRVFFGGGIAYQTPINKSWVIVEHSNNWYLSGVIPGSPYPTPYPTQVYPPPVPSPTYTPNPPTGVVNEAITSQQFENGLMMWFRSSNGIWVFGNDGRADYYPPNAYGYLPDNPLAPNMLPPPGRYLPIYGFGKIWGNYPSVRQRLGLGTGPELGYTVKVERQGVYGPSVKIQIIITFPGTDGQIVISDNGTWYRR